MERILQTLGVKGAYGSGYLRFDGYLPKSWAQMFASYADFVPPGWQTIEVEMDDSAMATGQVVMWVWDNVAQELEIFVGDLV